MGPLKPDLVAAGSGSSSYNGMYLATQNYDTNSFLFSTSRYVGIAGTSFAAPIVAGAAALVKQKTSRPGRPRRSNPRWSIPPASR